MVCWCCKLFSLVLLNRHVGCHGWLTLRQSAVISTSWDSCPCMFASAWVWLNDSFLTKRIKQRWLDVTSVISFRRVSLCLLLEDSFSGCLKKGSCGKELRAAYNQQPTTRVWKWILPRWSLRWPSSSGQHLNCSSWKDPEAEGPPELCLGSRSAEISCCFAVICYVTGDNRSMKVSGSLNALAKSLIILIISVW